MSKHKGGRAAILFVLFGGLGVGSAAYYVKSTPQATRVPDEVRVEKPPKRREPKVAVTKAEAEAEAAKPPAAAATKPIQTDTVRLPAFGDDIADMDLAKRETPVPGKQGAMMFLAQRIADAANFDGARVVNVDVRDHTAVIGYNAALAKGMGSMEEGAFLRALQVGFGQFTQIDRVQVESGGEPLQSGHVDLSEPLAVIRPGQAGEPRHDEP